MKKKRIDIGFELVKNFQKVILCIKDEVIEYETDSELRAKIRSLYTMLREESFNQFELIKGEFNEERNNNQTNN